MATARLVELLWGIIDNVPCPIPGTRLQIRHPSATSDQPVAEVRSVGPEETL
jgi:hypothetical protein